MKKRYWLWVIIEPVQGYFFKYSVYLDEDGKDTTGIKHFDNEYLIQRDELQSLDKEIEEKEE